MKRFWIFNTMVAMVLLAAAVAPVDMDSPSSASHSEMPDNNNDFACNLFRSIIEQKGSNSSIVVSPISVGYMLGMLNEGGDGETRQQITDVLGLGGSVQEINKYFKKKMDDVSNVDPKVTVKSANCIYFKMGERIIPHYKADMQKYYDAQIEAINFNSSNIVNKINSWCKIHTDGMIPKLVKKGELNPLDRMYILNAVYFKANWTKEFNPDETRDSHFTKQDGTTVKHRMMHLKTHAAYGKNDLCKMLCLPYGNGSYSMVVLLPHKGKTIDGIIQSFSAKKLEQMREQEMISREVDILMPRFSTESENKLIDVLSAMGMPRAFGGDAEFPNMLQGHHDDLYVSMMKQKAKIEVNEEGTKAAAVTFAAETTIGVNFDSYTFHATRPFVYYIVENSTGTIFFMGTYCGEEGGEKVNCSEDEEMEDCDEEPEIVVFERPIEKPVEKRTGAKEEIFRSVEQMPQFPGGDAALMKYIDSHLNYPPMAAQNKIQGRVVVQFVVEKDGSIGEVKVARSVDKDLDKEAVRIIKSLPKFIPGRQSGRAVSVWYTLPVTFRLPHGQK